MESAIHVLDTHSANQIAAGEVVERPASVVKELVENAIDAGAKHIDVTVEENGVPLIRVRDDGRGMSAADLPRAVLRHATSKIKRIEDLDDLLTLGFRGEALASIASVSNLEITSRPADETVGLSLSYNGGQSGRLKEVGCPVGTSVTVRDLFFNTPARLKFLKSGQTEFGQISDVVSRLALAHPDIAFSLAHPKKIVFQTSGKGDLLEAIGAVLGHATARKFIPLQVSQGRRQLVGYIGPLDLVRSSKQNQFFMLNGRIIRSGFLSNALAEGYHTLIPAKFHPVAVLHLRIPPAEYDVNVHPTKMEVRFREEKELTPFIGEGVRLALLRNKPLASFQTPAYGGRGIGRNVGDDERNTGNDIYEQPQLFISNRKQAPEVVQERTFGEDYAKKTVGRRENILGEHQNQAYEENRTQAPEENRTQSELSGRGSDRNNTSAASPETSATRSEDSAASTEASATLTEASSARPEDSAALTEASSARSENPAALTKDSADYPLNTPAEAGVLDRFWPLAQLFQTYILAEDGKDFVIIDQHAAHERINYEALLREFKNKERGSQTLLVPLPLEFTLQEEQAVLENLWILTEMGFILEQFGEKTYLLRGVPIHTGNVPADVLLREFIEAVLQKNTKPSLEQLVEGWIYLLACKASVKGRESLTLLEMEQLMARLNQTESPYTCPHGRPTMLKMTRAEVERRFYRA